MRSNTPTLYIPLEPRVAFLGAVLNGVRVLGA